MAACSVFVAILRDGRARARDLLRMTVSLLLALSIAPAAFAQSIEEKAQVCSACHGEKGIPQDNATPIIAGQHQGYLYLQLRDYKLGSRANDVMAPIAQALERDEMMALAEYFSKQPWPNLRQPAEISLRIVSGPLRFLRRGGRGRR